MLLSMLVLFGIIGVVYKPMTHMERFSSAEITAIVETAEQVDLAQAILASPEDAAVVLAYRSDASALTLVEGTDENGKKTNNRITFAEDFNYEEAKKATVVTAADLATYGTFTDDEISALTGNGSRLSNDVKTSIKTITNNYNPRTYYNELRALKSFDNENTPQEYALRSYQSY